MITGMSVLKKSVIFLAVVFMTLPGSVFGQYEFGVQPLLSYFKDAQRYELAFNYTMPSGYFEGVQQVNNGSYVGDTTVRRSIMSTGFGGSIGLTLPFKATGHISCWAVAIQLGVNMNTWTDLNSTYGADGSLVVPTSNALTASTMQIHLPIGIDWMVGNQAIKTQRLGFGASVGAGVIPQFNMTTVSQGAGLPTGERFGCTPYAKVDLAMRLGMVIKLRMMYTLGDISLIEVNKAIPGYTDGPFKVGSQSTMIFSLVLLPFSLGWHETDWYNTHDTYNQHDRLN
jgi:hypothetical protein